MNRFLNDWCLLRCPSVWANEYIALLMTLICFAASLGPISFANPTARSKLLMYENAFSKDSAPAALLSSSNHRITSATRCSSPCASICRKSAILTFEFIFALRIVHVSRANQSFRVRCAAKRSAWSELHSNGTVTNKSSNVFQLNSLRFASIA